MTVVLAHHCDGTVGTAATTVSEGFTSLHGTAPLYTAGGYNGQCLQFAGGASNYAQDNNTAQFLGLYMLAPSLPTVGCCFARVVISGGGAAAAAVLTTGGKIALYSSLSINVATSTTTITPGSWYRFEWNVTGTTQELRIFTDPAATTPAETLTGATAGAPFAWYYGPSWAANTGGPVNLDEITLCNAWPNMGVATPTGPTVRGVISGGVEVAATIRGVIQAGAEVAATIQQVIGGTAPLGGNALPAALPYTLT